VRHRCSKGDTYLGKEGVPNSHGESTKGELKVALGKTWKVKLRPHAETYVICKWKFSYHTSHIQKKINV
jgi:hypothetical protein